MSPEEKLQALIKSFGERLPPEYQEDYNVIVASLLRRIPSKMLRKQHPQRALSDRDVWMVRAKHKYEGIPQHVLAKQYNTSQGTISRAIHGAWGNGDPPENFADIRRQMIAERTFREEPNTSAVVIGGVEIKNPNPRWD